MRWASRRALTALTTAWITPVAAASGAANQFEDGEWFTTLDLFRYSAPGKLDLRVGGSPYFSINRGASAIESFSTGSAHGNGSQASHFGTSHLT